MKETAQTIPPINQATLHQGEKRNLALVVLLTFASLVSDTRTCRKMPVAGQRNTAASQLVLRRLSTRIPCPSGNDRRATTALSRRALIRSAQKTRDLASVKHYT